MGAGHHRLLDELEGEHLLVGTEPLLAGIAHRDRDRVAHVVRRRRRGLEAQVDGDRSGRTVDDAEIAIVVVHAIATVVDFAAVAKAKANKVKASKVKAASVLAAAKKLKKDARAAYLERELVRVDKPEALLDALGDALFDTGGNDAIGRTLLAIAKRTRNAALLDAIGQELELRWCEGEAITVLRLAIDAGSKNHNTRELLGRLLATRGDASCVELLEGVIEDAANNDEACLALALWFLDRDPERALTTLDDVDSAEADDLRAMATGALGRTAAAAAANAQALARYDSALDGHLELCEWHSNEHRYDRALFHARSLFEIRSQKRGVPAKRHDRVDEVMLHGFLRGRAFAEVVPWLAERCARSVPKALAWDVYEGLTSLNPIQLPEIAIRAAEVLAKTDSRTEARAWRVRIASIRASEQDLGPLAALAEDGLDNDAVAWVALANAYHANNASDAASAAVDRALQLDPSSVDALTAMYDLALHAGDLSLMERAARAVAEADPYGHEGCERLGRTLLRRGEGNAALPLAQQAVQAAPYCHNAQLGLGEAYLVVGDLARAREAAKRSAEIWAPDPGEATAVLLAALSGDPDALEAELVTAHRHLPTVPFPNFIAALRAAAKVTP